MSQRYQSIIKCIFRQLHDAQCRSNKIGILGVPFNKGQRKQGVEDGPKSLRNHGLIDEIKSIGKIMQNMFLES